MSGRRHFVNHCYYFLFLLLVAWSHPTNAQEGITFTFTDPQLVGGSPPAQLDFDVMIQGTNGDTRYGDMQVYIEYNAAVFGSNVVANENIHVTPGNALPTPFYTVVNIIDNTDNTLSITLDYVPDGLADFAEVLPDSQIQLLQISIDIANHSHSPGIRFNDGLMSDQQFQYDGNTIYDPVDASDVLDIALPIGEETGALNPAEDFYLYPNYPNPFNPVTQIGFRIPHRGGADAGFTSLKIHNLLGQEVATLIFENLLPGSYQTQWDGRDNSGKLVAGGMYFYRMVSGEFSQTRRMIFLR